MRVCARARMIELNTINECILVFNQINHFTLNFYIRLFLFFYLITSLLLGWKIIEKNLNTIFQMNKMI